MRTILATAAVFVLGCATGNWGRAVDGIRLQASVDPTDTGSIVLTLENGSSESVSYNLCSSTIERLDGTTWTQVEENRACTMELRILEPNGTDQFTVPLPPGAQPGEYRYTTGINRNNTGDALTVSSNTFRIGG
ncbi:MAG: immunoglobulin-like domain-containing protein [Longimicrobiales bacterium]